MSGTYPPSAILVRLAIKKAASTMKNPPATAAEASTLQCQMSRMARNRRVEVISMVAARHEKRAPTEADARKRKASANQMMRRKHGPYPTRLFVKFIRVPAECPEKGVGGTSMRNKERLKGILERLAAAAERERLTKRKRLPKPKK